MKITRCCAAIMASFSMLGCAQMQAPLNDTPGPPKARIVERDPFLECVAKLVRSYHVAPTKIAVFVMPVGDDTKSPNSYGGRDELPHNITSYFVYALNAFPTVVQLVGIPSKETHIDLYLKAAISGFDRFLENRTVATDVSVDRGPLNAALGRSREAGIGEIDIYAGAYDSQGKDFPVPLHAMLMAVVKHESTDQRVAVGAAGLTLAHAFGEKRIQGRHEALRVLSEYIVGQLIARHVRVPWPRCVDTSETKMVDVAIKDAVLGAVRGASNVELVKNVQELLRFHGESTARSGVLDRETVEALERFIGAVPKEERDIRRYLESSYWQLYEQIPADPERNKAIQEELDKGVDLAKGELVIDTTVARRIQLSNGTRIDVAPGRATVRLPIGDYRVAILAPPAAEPAKDRPETAPVQKRVTIHPSGVSAIKISATSSEKRVPRPASRPKKAPKPGAKTG